MPKLPNGIEFDYIEQWLNRHQGVEGFVCAPDNLTIYCPIEEPNALEEFLLLRAKVNELFQGSTVWDGEGSGCVAYPCAPKDVVTERVKVLTVAHHCTSPEQRQALAEALQRFAAATRQGTIGVAGSSHFFMIPTEALMLPDTDSP